MTLLEEIQEQQYVIIQRIKKIQDNQDETIGQLNVLLEQIKLLNKSVESVS